MAYRSIVVIDVVVAVVVFVVVVLVVVVVVVVICLTFCSGEALLIFVRGSLAAVESAF